MTGAQFGGIELGGGQLGEPQFGGPRFGQPLFAGRYFADPTFAGSMLADPPLAEPPFDEPTFAEPPFAGPPFAELSFDQRQFDQPQLEGLSPGTSQFADPPQAGPPLGGPRFDPDDERLARAAWSRLAEPGDTEAQELVAELGPAPALARALAGRGPRRWQTRLPNLDPVRDLATLARCGGRLLIPADQEWPTGLDGLGAAAPFCLWVRGPLSLAGITARAAAIVGSRAGTPYGLRVAAELADGCAKRGITVVSGAAFGIDGAAHRGALAAEGPTIAVLACGVDRAYPGGHEQLINRIGQVGVLVSEVPPGSSPTRWRFIERNRLIAALARVTVVVEAGHRSGAIGTANRADRLSLPVAAVPGPVTSPLSYGCHRLLRDGAVCVTSAAEVAELAGPIGEFLPDVLPVPAAVHDGLEPADLRVFDALPLRKPAGVASLSTVAGLDQPTVLAALGRLELRRLAQRDGGGWRRAADLGT